MGPTLVVRCAAPSLVRGGMSSGVIKCIQCLFPLNSRAILATPRYEIVTRAVPWAGHDAAVVKAAVRTRFEHGQYDMEDDEDCAELGRQYDSWLVDNPIKDRRRVATHPARFLLPTAPMLALLPLSAKPKVLRVNHRTVLIDLPCTVQIDLPLCGGVLSPSCSTRPVPQYCLLDLALTFCWCSFPPNRSAPPPSRPPLGLVQRGCPPALTDMIAQCWSDIPHRRLYFSAIVDRLKLVDFGTYQTPFWGNLVLVWDAAVCVCSAVSGSLLDPQSTSV